MLLLTPGISDKVVVKSSMLLLTPDISDKVVVKSSMLLLTPGISDKVVVKSSMLLLTPAWVVVNRGQQQCCATSARGCTAPTMTLTT